MNKVVAVAQLALCFVAVLCINSSGQNNPPEFAGKWVLVDGEFEELNGDMELLSDGTGFFEDTDKYKQKTKNLDGTWKIVDNRFVISVTMLGESKGALYYYKLSGYELMLSDDKDIENDGGYVALYIREENLEEYEKKLEAGLGETLNSGYVSLEKGNYKMANLNFNRVLRESKDSEKVKKAKEGLERVKKAEAKKNAEKAKASVSTFKDNRDGKTYKKVTIGNQTWMAENLNYATKKKNYSKCYGNKEENCEKYGRLYAWEVGACPAGWHLPNKDDWNTLLTNVGDDVGDIKSVSTKLKSTSGWDSYSNGTDDYGFSALPGGYIDGLYKKDLGWAGYWWISSRTGDDACIRLIGAGFGVIEWRNEFTFRKILYSIRCVQD